MLNVKVLDYNKTKLFDELDLWKRFLMPKYI